MSMSSLVKTRGRTFVLLGISGSGKDTQVRFLRRALPRSVEISTGDALRAVARRRNRAGRHIAAILRRGGIAPYWSAIYVWLRALFERLNGEEDLIFSGGPRLIEDARMLDDVMTDLGRPLPIVVYLTLSAAEARRRLIKRGRSDDNPRAIAGRFQFFQREVLPVVAYYRRRSRLITINGDQPVPAVWRDIRRALRLG